MTFYIVNVIEQCFAQNNKLIQVVSSGLLYLISKSLKIAIICSINDY